MIHDHIDKVSIDLYATGYRHITEECVDRIKLHLRDCERCGRRLLLAAKDRDTEQRQTDLDFVDHARKVFADNRKFIGEDAIDIFDRFFDLTGRDNWKGALPIGWVDTFAQALGRLKNVEDIGICLRVIFGAREDLGWQIWYSLDQMLLADRLATSSAIEDACSCITRIYWANKEAGHELFVLMDRRHLVHRAIDGGNIEDVLLCVSEILELDREAGIDFFDLVLDDIEKRKDSERRLDRKKSSSIETPETS